MATLFKNAVFHSMQEPGDVFSMLLEEEGVVVATGPEAQRLAKRAKVVDLQGRHAYPAMIDSHMHLLDTIALRSAGQEICRLADGGVEPCNLAGVEELVRSYAEGKPANALLVFTNYISVAMEEGRLPNRFELDEWAGGRRVWVLNIDGHSSSCSTALLDKLDLAEQAPDGILLGPAHDANLGLISKHLEEAVTARSLGDGIAAFCNDCARYGIGTVCALEGTDDVPRDKVTELLARLAGRMPVDVRIFPQYMDRAKLDRLLPAMGARRVGGCMKWELDGSCGSQTAAFSQPYLSGSQGELYFSDQEISGAVCSFLEEGFAVTAHAIGDRAIDQLLDAFEAAVASGCVRCGDEVLEAGDPRLAQRLRIDHCEFPSPDAVERICTLRPAVTVQPGYAWMDKHYLHGYERALPPQVIASQIPLRTLAREGILLLGSSDAPVQSVNPFVQMLGMRRFYVEDQSLSAYDALAAYTANAGKALGEKKGMLAPGYEASFFTTDADLLQAEPEDLETMTAAATYLHGTLCKPQKGGAGRVAALMTGRRRPI